MPTATIQQAMELAIQHHRAGKLAEAEAIYRQVLSHDPINAEAFHRLGTIAYVVGQYAVASQLIGRAIEINPNIADYHCNLGLAWQAQRQYPRAFACYQNALRLNPDSADVHYNLGNAMLDLGKLDEAIASYRAALRLNPNLVGAHNNLGSALKSQGLLDEAIESYRRAISIAQHNSVSHSNLLYALHFHPRYDAHSILHEHRAWNKQYAEPLKSSIQPHLNSRDPSRKLRIGYVSPDLREHAVGRFLLPLIENHDRNHVEIFCYASLTDADQLTAQLQRVSSAWRNIVGMADADVAELIRNDAIDILVDLTMHMSNSRLLVFARKPAPVQVTYLAYCSTTGLDAIDWRITDPYLDPPGSDLTCYSEKTISLPETYWCYQPAAVEEVTPLPARARGFVTFASLNNFAKVTDEALSAWSRILSNCPGSRLLLHAREGSHRNRVESLLGSRVLFVDYIPTHQYFEQYASIDIALDPFPYNGGTTTCDALWMGVPVVSLAGETAVSRAGLSILSNIAHPELVAKSVDEYVEIATALANDFDRLAELRSSLRERMRNSPLMNAPRFARNMESIYRTIWNQWCGEQNQKSSVPWLALAREHQRAGRFAEVESICREILQNERDHADALHHLAIALTALGKHEEAVATLGRAVQVNPKSTESYNNLGNALLRLNRTREAIEALEKARGLSPGVAGVYLNLGTAYFQAGDVERGIAAHRQAIALAPQSPIFHHILGKSLKSAGRLDEAIAEFRTAIQLHPDFIDAYTDLSAALHEKRQSDQAIQVARQALQRRPNSTAICNSLGYLLRNTGQLDEAIEYFHKAIAIDPHCVWAHSALIHTLYFHPSYDNAAIDQENRQWNDRHARPLVPLIVPHANDRSPDRRLRVGYISADFRSHCQSFFTLPLLSHHDREHFEIFCYADLTQPDETTQKLKSHVDGWRPITGMSDQAVADLIRQDRIDILVDLTLHMIGNRLLVFARKPAPVQVTWLGYPGSTGLDTMDYRITDASLDPPGTNDQYYSEQSMYLPDSFWCYDALSDEPCVNPIPPSIRNDHGQITFGSMNSFAKINRQVLALWASVLRAVPNARLLILANPGQHRQRTLDLLQGEGVDPGRVEFAETRSRPAYLELFHRIDIALDTFPANGHTTTMDALWMGVPVITLPGRTAISRGALSILHTMGLSELAARSEDEYVKIASGLAGDPDRLKLLRSMLRSQMKNSPLMDAPRFARNMEAAYRRMWQKWCSR